MGRPHQRLGSLLREFRLKRDLTQEEVVEAVAALESEGRYYDERTLRRYESGEIRPSRSALIVTVVKVYKQTDPEKVNCLLRVADYDTLIQEEISLYGLSLDRLTDTSNTPMPPAEPQMRPEPQETLWGPNNGPMGRT